MREQIREMMPLSEKEAVRIMLVKKQDELTTCRLDDRTYQRLKLRNEVKTIPLPNGQSVSLDQIMGHNQTKMISLEKAVKELYDMYKDASFEIPLDKELRVSDNKGE